MAPAGVGVGRLRSGPVGLADLAERNGGSTPSTTAQWGTPQPLEGGVPFEKLGVEEPDLVAEPPAGREDVGQDQPAGDPPVLVAVVVEDRPGQVGAAERLVEPPGDQPGDRVGRARDGRSRGSRRPAGPPRPADGPRRRARRRRRTRAAWSRQKPTTVTSNRVSSASGSGGTSSTPPRGRVEPEPAADPRGDPPDLSASGCSARGISLGGREPRPIASEATLNANPASPADS